MSDLFHAVRQVVAELDKDATRLNQEGWELWSSACAAPTGDEKNRLMDLCFKTLFRETLARQMRESYVKAAFDLGE